MRLRHARAHVRAVTVAIAALLLAAAPAAAHQPDPLTCAGYAESRQFVDAQSWWTPTPGRDGVDHGHIHVGTCIPERELIAAPTTLDVRVVLHDNPGRISYVSIVSKTRDQEITQVKSYELFRMTCPVGTCVRWIKLPLDPAWFNYSGLQEIRLRAFVNEPDGNGMNAAFGWQTYVANGRPHLDVRAKPWLRGHGRYTGAGYCEAAIKSVPLPDAPVAGTWQPVVQQEWYGRAEDLPVSHHTVRLDPDFHAGVPGTILEEGPGPFTGPVAVDAEPGPHKLLARSDCADDTSGSTNAGVLVVGFDAR